MTEESLNAHGRPMSEAHGHGGCHDIGDLGPCDCLCHRDQTRTSHENDGDCRVCGTPSLDCWRIGAFNKHFCCDQCDHVNEPIGLWQRIKNAFAGPRNVTLLPKSAGYCAKKIKAALLEILRRY